MIKRTPTYFPIIFLVLFFAESISAQTYSHARSLGMAGAYTAVARGVATPIWNPANLALKDRPGFDLNLLGAGLLLGNSSFSKSHYDAYVGKYLSFGEIQNILASVPEEGLRLYLDSGIQAVGFAIGPFALTASGTGASNLRISRDYLRLALEGIRWGQSYDIGNNSGEAFAYSSVTASFAFPIASLLFDQMYFGANASYLIGFGYSNVVESSGQFYNGFESYGQGSVKVRYGQGGSGYASDLGLAAVRGKWNFGLALRNALSNINWKKDTEQFEAFFSTIGSLNIENSVDVDEDSLITHGDETREIEPFSTGLPKEIRIGLLRKGNKVILAVDYHQGFADRAGVSKKPYIAVGSEWIGIGFLPLRFGVGLGGNTGVLLAAGLGLKLGFFRLDYGVNTNGLLAASQAKALGMAVSTSLSF